MEKHWLSHLVARVVPRAADPVRSTRILHHFCGLTSYHPRDVSERYCGYCHRWLDPGEYTIQGEMYSQDPPEKPAGP